MKLYQLLKQNLGGKIYLIAALIVISGICNLMLLQMLSKMLTSSKPSPEIIFLYPGILLAFFISSRVMNQMILRIGLKNTVSIRTRIIEGVANASFNEFEKIGKEPVLSSLTNDTQALSNSPAVLTLIFSSMSTILVCFVYMAVLSLKTFLFMAVLLTLSTLAYLSILKGVWKDTRLARAVEDIFFRYIGDLLGGFRELKINENKRNDFVTNDLMPTIYRNYEMRWRSGSKFADATLAVNILFYLILGAISFALVFWFETKSDVVITYLLMMIFLLGPIKTVMGNYQNLMQLEVAAGKVLELLSRLHTGAGTEKFQTASALTEKTPEAFEFIEFDNVSFSYSAGDAFGVGPVNLRINKGEILFIAGGNGSGKTTLIQMLLGLYRPTSGRILFNGKTDLQEMMLSHRSRFSVIYSDFYLFHKLYGLERTIEEAEASLQLEKLRLQHKVSVKENTFSTIALSQGQKKRLALLNAYFEDKEILILDEFAADQDPEFRDYFYTELLQDLRKANKTIIAITHDDKYYNCCDRFIKLDLGKVVTEKTGTYTMKDNSAYALHNSI